MMRHTRNLLALGLLLCPALAMAKQIDVAPGRGGPKIFSHSERRTAPVTLAWTVELEKKEWRTKEDAARQDVLLKAQQKITDWLRERYPHLPPMPSVEFITSNLTKEEVSVIETDVVDGEQQYSAKVKLHLTPDMQRKLQQEADHWMEQVVSKEAWNRQWLLMKGLFFLMALAGASAGYFHLDDRFQGYYTKPLRIAALAAAALAGYGIALLP